MSIYKEKFGPEYQNLVGMNSPTDLHRNSLELVDVLLEKNILKNNIKVFEIGAAGCRNLKYINDYNPNIELFANDLHKEASMKNCHEFIKDKVNFYEKDTLSLFKDMDIKVDLLIASDHLMHIDTESVNIIVNLINTKWKPHYVLLREVKSSGHKPNRTFPRLHHNFNFFSYKEVLYRNSITNPDLYYVKLFEIK